MKVNKRKISLILLTALLLLSCVGQPMLTLQVRASQSVSASEMRESYRTQLNRYYTELKMVYDISDETLKQMDKIYNSAMNYMKYCFESEVAGCYERTVTYLEEYLDTEEEKPSTTKEFLLLSNVAPVPSASYGEDTFVVLSLMNLGVVDIKDVVITPNVSNDKKEWPFEITQAYDAQQVAVIPAASTMDEALAKRMDVGWSFKVREDVLTGYYPLTFTVKYYMDNALETTEITSYINITGSNPAKLLIPDDEIQTSNPRIIVTGFTTTPETIYAGSTFNLSVSVKNTSQTTTVKNVLFNLEATVEGSDSTAAYAAFLPVSGSSSVYTESIAPGQTYQMSIDMEAKSDLAQKPYVLTVSMKYDTDEQINISDTAKVSVPIKQEAKMDTSAAEVLPESIAVGEQSNIMFSVYNTGKTTLYNVKVMYEGDTVESGITYLGNVAPGATSNVDSMVTGIAQDTGDGTITAVITYEDEAGAETRFEKVMNLYVYEMMIDESFTDEIPYEPEETQSGPNVVVFAAVAVGIIILVVIVVIVVKKKKAKKHQADVDLLDEDDE